MSEISSFERVWEHREEPIFPLLFGPTSRGTFVLCGELFAGVFSQESYDPRWRHYGVIESAPQPRNLYRRIVRRLNLVASIGNFVRALA